MIDKGCFSSKNLCGLKLYRFVGRASQDFSVGFPDSLLLQPCLQGSGDKALLQLCFCFKKVQSILDKLSLCFKQDSGFRVKCFTHNRFQYLELSHHPHEETFLCVLKKKKFRLKEGRSKKM